MDQRDLATVVMLSLASVLAIVVVMYFMCIWHSKTTRTKERTTPKPTKPVQRTFSRFSQVDEELTMHSVRESVLITELTSEPGTSQKKIPNPEPVTDKKMLSPTGSAYLETHM